MAKSAFHKNLGIIGIGTLALAAMVWGYSQMMQVNQLTVALHEATSKLTANTSEISNLRIQLQSANGQLKDSRTQLQEASKPDMPVTISFRKGLMFQGFVAVLKNSSPKVIESLVTVEDPTTHQKKAWSIVVNGGAVQEIGGVQGWQFVPGQHVVVSNPDYRPIEMTVPSA